MRRILNIWIALSFTVLAWSQGTNFATGVPYECSFEESEDLSAWVLNYGTPTATDKWMFGTAVHSEGRRSMYISADGVNPCYGKNQNIVVSYLRYKFPTSTGTQKYEVSFDWKGVGDSTTSKLFVMFGLESEFFGDGAKNLNALINLPHGRIPEPSPGSATVPAVYNACQNLGENADKFVCGSETWQNVTFTNKISINAANSNNTFMFVFIWANSNTRDSVNRSSIAIDNFQINSGNIQKPENVRVVPHCEDSTMLVTWESGLPEFDIQYRKTGDLNWTYTISGITDGMEGFSREDGTICSYSLKRILEGTYDVRIRGKYDELRTNYVYDSQVLVYCPDNHCVNFVDLYGQNVVCTYGYHPNAQQGATPYDNIGIIDYGPDAEESRHTLHVDPTEVDPRTDSLLHTVPKNALASVRLGNWKWGGEAESVTYDILVDTTSQGILIVHYAVVFENPQGHPVEDEPAFKLEIMKPDGSIIDELCGQASFTYSSSEQDPEHWHTTRDGQVAWKDWTTVGVSLMNFHNQNIKVRFTTLDCGWSGHYAYAYFTLDCANAHIQTENCGLDARVNCIAPEGFAYYWYNENGDSLGNEQSLEVDASRQKITCQVSFIEEPSCYFLISTTSEPRFPVPEYTFERLYGDCSSRLKFNNTSHVMNKFEGYETHTSEPCNESLWTFRRLSNGATKRTSDTSPIYLCPPEGDSIEVSLTAYIGANNSCEDTRTDTIVVPSIVPENSVFYVTTCPEAPYKFGDCPTCWYDTDTTVTISSPNFAGCDSTSTLHLTVNPVVADTYIHDSICSDGGVTINGVRYNKPVENQLIMLKTSQGCDSALYLTLTVNQRLQASVENESFVCADDEQLYLYLHITAGEFDSLEIRFDTPQLRDTVIYDSSVATVAIPYPETITPGMYRVYLRFYQFCCGVYTEEHNIEMRYRSSIVEQKWNDVLTVLSPKYNGGFEFSAFQWYKDGQPIAGATHSYLYQDLDFNSTYYVELTREDGTVMTTCPIQPVYHEQQTPFPTIAPAGQQMPMYMDKAVTIWYYTISGQLYRTFGLPQGYTTLPIPEQTGAYIIKSVNSQGETQAQVMIVE